MAKFQKDRPDATRCVPVPEWAYHRLGGIEKNPQNVLLLSAMLGGAVVTEDKKEVQTPRGIVTVAHGQVWCSVDTMLEDAFATAGASFTRAQARYSITNKMEQEGMITDSRLVHPETRGHYGKIYTLSPELLNPDQPHVNVVQGYRLFYYGNPEDFQLAEIVVGNLKAREEYDARYGAFTPDYVERMHGVKPPPKIRRGRYGKVDQWLAQVAEEGLEQDAFTNVGRWRQGEAGDPNAPVFVPYFPIDIDREELYQAFLDAQEVVYRAEERGYDLRRVYVSFSGRRGFHVQISADQVGCPLFTNSMAAQEMTSYVAADLTKGIERDPSVESPLSLFRATGSKHSGSGLYKVTWTADDFQSLDYDDVLLHARNGVPFTFPKIVTDDLVDEVLAHFIDMSENAAANLYEKLRRERRGGKSAGEGIKALIGGVAEGENFHAHHVGRNKAGFNLACWLEEGKRTDDPEIDEAAAKGGTELAMEVWNKRNSPPMSTSEVRGRIASARRKVNR